MARHVDINTIDGFQVCQLPIANCQLPIANFQLPIANCQLPIASCQLPKSEPSSALLPCPSSGLRTARQPYKRLCGSALGLRV